MAKRTGIVTFHSLYNIGAVLQAFALQRTIQSVGYSCEIIDFLRSSRGTPHHMFCIPRNVREVIHNFRVLSTLRSRLEMRKRFAEFRSRHMVLTPKSYDSNEALKADRLPMDVFVTGSDMVWNPAWLKERYAPVYYLDFVTSGRRVAYAPSFACSEIPVKNRERIANYLRPFDFLSCREEAGCDIIRQLIGREAVHVLDPTLLQPAAEYDKVAIDPPGCERYILMYPMHSSKELCQVAMNVRKCLGLPIVAIVPVYRNPREFRFADRVTYNAGPGEFLGWMRKTDFVCTNSFHGAAFSVIYRKRFVSVPISGGSNTRAQGFLMRMGLLSRQVNNRTDLQQGDQLFSEIDYAPVEVRLKQAVEESLSYLKRALA